MKALFACALLAFSIHAAEPLLEKTDLFEGGKDGFALYRIPGMVVTSTGAVLAYCEARQDGRSDWGEIEVHLRRSPDGCKIWEPARKIAHTGERVEGNPKKAAGGEHEQTVNNPVAIVDRSGVIHFLYCLNYARCFYMQSKDDGLTFSAPVELTAAFEAFRSRCPWNVLATGPGHGIQLQSGRLVVPVWLAYGKKPGDHSPSMSGTIYSDDAGQTWHAGDIALPNKGEFLNPNESAVAELSDGRVLFNARTQSKSNRRLTTVSANGATGWSAPHFDAALWDPMCMGSLIRVSGEKGVLLFSNPHSLKLDAAGVEVPGGRGDRRNLSIKLSRDDGTTWPVNKTLEAGSSAYSDLGAAKDGTIFCFYERDKRLTMARFNREWLQGK